MTSQMYEVALKREKNSPYMNSLTSVELLKHLAGEVVETGMAYGVSTEPYCMELGDVLFICCSHIKRTLILKRYFLIHLLKIQKGQIKQETSCEIPSKTFIDCVNYLLPKGSRLRASSTVG